MKDRWNGEGTREMTTERGKATSAGINRNSDEWGYAPRYMKIRTNEETAC